MYNMIIYSFKVNKKAGKGVQTLLPAFLLTCYFCLTWSLTNIFVFLLF